MEYYRTRESKTQTNTEDHRSAMSQADLIKLRSQATSSLNQRSRLSQQLPESFDDPRQLNDFQHLDSV
jgi:hypothetical protein